jgi:hypothetical protein
MATRNQTDQRREYRRWPRAKEAAEKIGCDYSHLRRCVAGKRHSPDTLAKYYALLNDQTNPEPKP